MGEEDGWGWGTKTFRDHSRDRPISVPPVSGVTATLPTRGSRRLGTEPPSFDLFRPEGTSEQSRQGRRFVGLNKVRQGDGL